MTHALEIGAAKPKLGGDGTELLRSIWKAEAALDGGSGEDCREALADLLAWNGLRPSPGEKYALRRGDANPCVYAAIPMNFTVAPQIPGQVVSTPQGEFAVMFFQLAVPMTFFKPTRVLSSTGADNPAGAMLPSVVGRFVLPRDRLAPDTLRALGLEHSGAEEAVGAVDTPQGD